MNPDDLVLVRRGDLEHSINVEHSTHCDDCARLRVAAGSVAVQQVGWTTLRGTFHRCDVHDLGCTGENCTPVYAATNDEARQ